MGEFNLTSFVAGFVKYSLSGMNPNAKGKSQGAPMENTGANSQFQMPQGNLANNTAKQIAQSIIQQGFNSKFPGADIKMNQLANLERGLYIKDLMKLPKEINEMLAMIQKNIPNTTQMPKLLAQNINILELAQFMQQNGKEAMGKLVQAMAEASKQGITDMSQLKDAMKLINASISVAGQENPTHVIKNFMLLYLPWLPLQEGVDFELEINNPDGESSTTESSITLLITTRNYENIKAVLLLSKENKIDIFITCIENFPKEELLKKINEESKRFSIHASTSVEQTTSTNQERINKQAKVTISNTTQINPFLLLMANALIRYTIEIDNQAE